MGETKQIPRPRMVPANLVRGRITREEHFAIAEELRWHDALVKFLEATAEGDIAVTSMDSCSDVGFRTSTFSSGYRARLRGAIHSLIAESRRALRTQGLEIK